MGSYPLLMAEHNELGELGEALATIHLKKNNFEIMERNWRYGKEEVDIIAKKGDEIVIVEVKTRNSDFFGEPEQAVSKSKQTHLVRAAHAYVTKKDIDLEVRFDVIGIVINNKERRLNHIEGAFQPRW